MPPVCYMADMVFIPHPPVHLLFFVCQDLGQSCGPTAAADYAECLSHLYRLRYCFLPKPGLAILFYLEELIFRNDFYFHTVFQCFADSGIRTRHHLFAAFESAQDLDMTHILDT